MQSGTNTKRVMRVTRGLLAFLFCVSPFVVQGANNEDINGDTHITLHDVLTGLKVLTGEAVADINGSIADGGGSVGLPEVIQSLEWVVEKSESGPRPRLPVIYTPIPKQTSVIADFTNKYTIDLVSFGISNDGTSAVATTSGINDALQYAKTLGANHIIFPAGTYLIDENSSIILDHQDTIIDLNGATLQVRTNDLQAYKVVKIIEPARNMRLTNGTIKGDRDTHTYTASYESGNALVLSGGSNLEIDNVTVSHCTGSGVVIKTGMSTDIPYSYIQLTALESGAFSDQGVKIADNTKTRTQTAYNLSKFGTEFEFGNTTGYQGYPYITSSHYQAYFYDEHMNFLEKKRCLQFQKISIPAGAQNVQLEFNQSEVVSNVSYCGRITNLKPPRDVHFHHNTMSYNRMLNLSVVGGQKWIIENNFFEKSGGQAPGFAVDFEDGWDLMQNIVFRKNTFKDNAGDLVVAAGSELIFEENDFTTTVSFWGRAENYTFRNNRIVGEKVATNGSLFGGFAGFRSYSGHCSIHDNHYENSDMTISPPDAKHPVLPLITLKNETLINMAKIYGTRFSFTHSTIDDTRYLMSSKTKSFTCRECSFLNDSYLHFYEDGPDVLVTLDNCTGVLGSQGPFEDRWK